MSVRPKADPSLQWAYRPDEETRSALARGRDKFKEHPELGSDRPHEGGLMAKALAAEKAPVHKPRRKKMAKKVKLKELAERSKKKARFDTEDVKTPEKKGKLIPLKQICADLDIDPKATRVKLRRLIAKGEIDFHDTSARWEFTPAQAKEIRSVLS